MSDFAPDAFTLFSTFNRSKIEGKEDEYWAKAEWPIEQIAALHEWAVTKAEQIENQKGEMCVVVAQKLLPRTSKTGNEYLLGVTSNPKQQIAATDLF
ncbi:MAG: hypothetical protein ACO28M_10980 [Vulcanococcus sp.]